VPGKTTSAKRRAVSFQKISWLTISSWRARAASTRAVSANDGHVSAKRSSAHPAVLERLGHRGVWFGT
jgi:hypothetical protein